MKLAPAQSALSFDLHVRGSVPRAFAGSLIVAASRRHKDPRKFFRWHDSQADLFRFDLHPGRPGRVRAHLLPVDSSGASLGIPSGRSYATQPNHGINIRENTVWATNLLFGAPLEVDLHKWKARRILRYVEPDEDHPQISSTSHFAWSLDRRFAYFHQSLFERESSDRPVRAAQLILVELDAKTGRERQWKLIPPVDDAALETANFHSAFYYEESGRKYVGLLRTGALLESVLPHSDQSDHLVLPSSASTIWVVEIDHTVDVLQAQTLPGIREIEGLSLSHLDVDATGANGFVLFANYKQADVAEETHGRNIYGEPPEQVRELYAGMMTQPLNYGAVIRYERRNGKVTIQKFRKPYDPACTSEGHSWMPINLEIDPSRRYLFATFNGFHPRLLPQHICDAYPGYAVDPASIRYVPPLLMRFRADTLEPDFDSKRRHLSYAEPVAMAAVGDETGNYVCTFSPELGLRIYFAEDLSKMICHAICPELMNWQDTHFRPDPAHMQFTRS